MSGYSIPARVEQVFDGACDNPYPTLAEVAVEPPHPIGYRLIELMTAAAAGHDVGQCLMHPPTQGAK